MTDYYVDQQLIKLLAKVTDYEAESIYDKHLEETLELIMTEVKNYLTEKGVDSERISKYLDSQKPMLAGIVGLVEVDADGGDEVDVEGEDSGLNAILAEAELLTRIAAKSNELNAALYERYKQNLTDEDKQAVNNYLSALEADERIERQRMEEELRDIVTAESERIVVERVDNGDTTAPETQSETNPVVATAGSAPEQGEDIQNTAFQNQQSTPVSPIDAYP